jgi:molybdopterin molybdotransferase
VSLFDSYVMVDWSGGNDRGPRPKADAIWACEVRDGQADSPIYLRNRKVAEDWLAQCIKQELDAGRRLFLGFDFPFGYPKGLGEALVGSCDPFRLWKWFEKRIVDAPKSNNRFDIAAEINLRFGGKGPFWSNGLKRDIDGLGRTKAGYVNPFPDRRAVETLAKGSFTCWQMAGAGAVGSQVMMGLPVLERLRQRFKGQISVWPFEELDTPVAFVEIWPSLNLDKPPEGRIKDAWQVEQVALSFSRMPDNELQSLLDVEETPEGWILGVPPSKSKMSTQLTPPPLRNDCFALPAGVNWTPVDEALALLRDRLSVVTGTEQVSLAVALGRVLAEDVIAARSNPPLANSAVDGYGFAGAIPKGAHVMPLVPSRAAAGGAYEGTVPAGSAVRVLTGAALPDGVDTVILQEDVTVGDANIAFHGPLKAGSNARAAGEDVVAGELALSKGRVITAVDLALLSAVGVAQVAVFQRLRVAVLSTGDELVEPGQAVSSGSVYDANRPMLLAMLGQSGFVPVDMGRVPDDRAALRLRLDQAAEQADVILTSGGASAGDEDHVSALLQESGAMQEWRIAVKPGRPLALGLWDGKPVFGLPGNPVAAMVCTLVFARPAMGVLAGMAWQEPQGFDVPAAFEKGKKPGRREYLRARIRDGRAEVFASEGSGRISGLSWAEGLVELGDEERVIQPGDMVRYIPYAGFGA